MSERRYRLLGINDDETTCTVCGKVELKRVMWLQELDPDGGLLGDPFWCGTTCGAKLLRGRYTPAQLAKVAKNYDYEVYRKRQTIYMAHPAKRQADDKLMELDRLQDQLRRWRDFEWRMAHPLMTEYRRLDAEARAAADAVEIVIEL